MSPREHQPWDVQRTRRTNPEAAPWERQPRESDQAFAAFSLYMKLGPNGSYRKVARRLHKSLTLIARWGRRWHWQDRIFAYDNEMARRAFEEHVARRLEEARIMRTASEEAARAHRMRRGRLNAARGPDGRWIRVGRGR